MNLAPLFISSAGAFILASVCCCCCFVFVFVFVANRRLVATCVHYVASRPAAVAQDDGLIGRARVAAGLLLSPPWVAVRPLARSDSAPRRLPPSRRAICQDPRAGATGAQRSRARRRRRNSPAEIAAAISATSASSAASLAGALSARLPASEPLALSRRVAQLGHHRTR